MPDNSSRYHRHSIRLPDYDYSSPGAYFVTIVTLQREALLGEIVDGEMCLGACGRVVWEVWLSLPGRYPQIDLDEAVVMPNHFHGILWIKQSVGAIHELPLPEHRRLTRRQMLLPLVMGYFKMNTAKKINEIRGTSAAVLWQRNFYERVIRNERELDAIRRYISNNPLQWELDRENPIHRRE